MVEIEAEMGQRRDAASLVLRTRDSTILARYDANADRSGDTLKPGDKVRVTGQLSDPFGGYNLELTGCHFAPLPATSSTATEVIPLIR